METPSSAPVYNEKKSAGAVTPGVDSASLPEITQVCLYGMMNTVVPQNAPTMEVDGHTRFVLYLSLDTMSHH
jgi:hypothetical protein